jgi:NADH-ubiquinone oxidoreductase chain 6
MKQIFIDILAFATLFSSLLVITSKNPVISVVFLISVFINAAGYLLLTGINFIGISYIIIYIGAIAVLFLFVIMMININLTEIQEVGSQYTKNLPLAFAIALLFIYELITILPFTFNDISIFSYALNYLINFSSILFSNSNTNFDFNDVHITVSPIIPDTSIINFTQIEAIGHVLYTYNAIWLIICSIILLLSMIAPIILHSNKNNNN